MTYDCDGLVGAGAAVAVAGWLDVASWLGGWDGDGEGRGDGDGLLRCWDTDCWCSDINVDGFGNGVVLVVHVGVLVGVVVLVSVVLLVRSWGWDNHSSLGNILLVSSRVSRDNDDLLLGLGVSLGIVGVLF